jgi:hypothetical protein
MEEESSSTSRSEEENLDLAAAEEALSLLLFTILHESRGHRCATKKTGTISNGPIVGIIRPRSQ